MVNGAGNTRQWVDAPPVTPSPYGLFSAATVLDDGGSGAQGGEGLRWALSGITWEPAACGAAYETLAACEAADQDAEGLTVVDGINAVESSPFTAYHLHRCRLPGRDWTAGDERAAEALRLGEQRAAERHLMRAMASADEVSVLSAQPVHPVEALGLLERHVGLNYGGTGVLHVDPLVATLMGSYGLLTETGTSKLTKLGTRVAVGGGYGAGLAPSVDDAEPGTPAAGEAWAYVTGQVMVRRAATAEVIRSAAGQLTSNEYLALATRPYVIGWECVTAAVRLRTTYGVPQ